MNKLLFGNRFDPLDGVPIKKGNFLKFVKELRKFIFLYGI